MADAPKAPPAETEETKEKAETPEGKADLKALKSVNSNKVSEDDIAAAEVALDDTADEQAQKLADAMAAFNVTNAKMDTLSGNTNYTMPEF